MIVCFFCDVIRGRHLLFCKTCRGYREDCVDGYKKSDITFKNDVEDSTRRNFPQKIEAGQAFKTEELKKVHLSGGEVKQCKIRTLIARP